MAGIKGLEGMTGAELQMQVNQGGKFVLYKYCISIVIMTFRRGSDIHFIKAGESGVGKGLKFTLLSMLLGWWGIPWGPIYTIEAIIVNFGGGKNVTQEVLASMRNVGSQ